MCLARCRKARAVYQIMAMSRAGSFPSLLCGADASMVATFCLEANALAPSSALRCHTSQREGPLAQLSLSWLTTCRPGSCQRALAGTCGCVLCGAASWPACAAASAAQLAGPWVHHKQYQLPRLIPHVLVRRFTPEHQHLLSTQALKRARRRPQVFKEFVERSFRGGSRSGKAGNAYDAPEGKAPTLADDSAKGAAAEPKPVPKADPV